MSRLNIENKKILFQLLQSEVQKKEIAKRLNISVQTVISQAKKFGFVKNATAKDITNKQKYAKIYNHQIIHKEEAKTNIEVINNKETIKKEPKTLEEIIYKMVSDEGAIKSLLRKEIERRIESFSIEDLVLLSTQVFKKK